MRGARADVDRAVSAARGAFDDGPWPQLAPGERADAMAKLHGAIQARAGELAGLITAGT